MTHSVHCTNVNSFINQCVEQLPRSGIAPKGISVPSLGGLNATFQPHVKAREPTNQSCPATNAMLLRPGNRLMSCDF